LVEQWSAAMACRHIARTGNRHVFNNYDKIMLSLLIISPHAAGHVIISGNDHASQFALIKQCSSAVVMPITFVVPQHDERHVIGN